MRKIRWTITSLGSPFEHRRDKSSGGKAVGAVKEIRVVGGRNNLSDDHVVEIINVHCVEKKVVGREAVGAINDTTITE